MIISFNLRTRVLLNHDTSIGVTENLCFEFPENDRDDEFARRVRAAQHAGAEGYCSDSAEEYASPAEDDESDYEPDLDEYAPIMVLHITVLTTSDGRVMALL